MGGIGPPRGRLAVWLEFGHAPSSHAHPRRRHRARAGGGDAPRPRRLGRGVRLGGRRRRRGASWRSTGRRCLTTSSSRSGATESPSRARSRRRSARAFASVNVTLRQALGLYANLRPARSIKGLETRYEDVDLVIVRENTEDLYAGIEHMVGPTPPRASRSSPARRPSGSPASPSSTPSPTAGARSRPSTRPTS